MATQVTNYQCPSCTAPLHFDNVSGRLVCDYCGASYSVEDIEAYYAEKDAQAQAAFQQAAENAQQQAEVDPNAPQLISETEKQEMLNSKWDGSTIADDWGEDSANMVTYNCPSCGAELLCEVTTAATHCPYCGNPSIVPGQLGGALKPDCIIPFKLDKNAAVQALKKYFQKRLLLPRTFTRTSHLQKVQGVYVPFWLFNADATADCWYEGTNSHSHREGDYRVTRTDHFDVRRFGTVAFRQVPTDASKKMPDELMDSLEPFDYRELKPFSTAYLPGYLADKYDVTYQENSRRADARCKNTTLDVMRSDVRGYQMVKDRRKNVYLDRGSVQYGLLPVWMLKVQWNGKSFLYAMNGQTGRLVGDLPVDKKRFWGLCAIITAVLGALLFFSGIGDTVARVLQEFLADFFG